MGRGWWSERLPLPALVLVALGVLVCLVGCGTEAAVSEADTLQQRFPEQASRVLERGDPFAATEEGFAVERLEGGPTGFVMAGRPSAVLPKRGEGAIRWSLDSGFEVRVREIGAGGEGKVEGRTVVYARTGGASFWAATEGGYEEWLSLEAGAATAEKAVAAWEVEGAEVRQQGEEGVEVIDAAGVARIRVSAPVAFLAAGREVKARLEGRGRQIALWVDAGGEAALIDPLWMSAASMSEARTWHTATLLGTGKVLVAGGDNGSSLASAELYDPATETWSPAGAMSEARYFHTATLLGNGKVLVAGGDHGGSLATAELYDPATDSWSLASAMSEARYSHTATLLGSGKVLVAGGLGVSGSLARAELYDPTTDTWSPAGAMSQARAYHTATLLESGALLVAGGAKGGSDFLTSSELYNPTTNAWSSVGAMSQTRAHHTATLLGNGKVLVTGPGANAELYKPEKSLWISAGAMSQARAYHTATLLGSGKVLVAGGTIPEVSAELYDPATNTWSSVGAMSQARLNHAATRLKGGEVLVSGGNTGAGRLNSAELYSTLAPPGSVCGLVADCQSGFCVDGVCCDSACNGGPCEVCSVAAGAASNGTCSHVTGQLCDDGNSCTQGDTCHAGVCGGFTKPDGDACDDGDACTQSDTCQAGFCVGTTKADGSACDDSDACTQSDTCQAGACIGASPVSCPSPAACQLPGVCDKATGVCSHPEKPDGTPCGDGSTCAEVGTCQMGVCILGKKPDGAACDDGDPCTQHDACRAGVCVGAAKDCSPRLCIKATGQCRPDCGSIDDCADGFVCDASGQCVEPLPEASLIDFGGCGCRSAGALAEGSVSRWEGALGVLLLSVGAARRRRRA